MMDASEAHRIATEIVRQKLDRGFTRESIRATTFEGGHLWWAPGVEYLIRAGKVSIAERMPWPPRGDEHSFRIDDLFSELDAPQGSLFA
jgi:hypothetical protein